MAYATGFLGIVATIQGAAWLGSARVGRRRRAQGSVLAAFGALLLIGSLLHLGAPEFFRPPV